MPGGKLPDIFISTHDAGRLLGCGQQSIETGLRNGTFPIGWAWLTEEEGRRGQWNYRIPREALKRAIESGEVPRSTEGFIDTIEERVFHRILKFICKGESA